MNNAIRIDAPAKVNLTLRVLARRPDGYHDLESWIVPVSWTDTLQVTRHDSWRLEISGRTAGLPPTEDNLVTRAARALASEAKRSPDAFVRLQKNLPAAAGLGGGSSDAGASLSALNRLWQLDWTVERLQALAATIGSDVPAFVQPRCAVLRGRGENIKPVQLFRTYCLVLVLPPFGLSTGRVFAAWQLENAARKPVDSRPWEGPAGDARTLDAALFNDLTPAAFRCEARMEALHRRLDGIRGARLHLTGSGSTFFTIFDDRAAAEAWRHEASRLSAGVAMRIVDTIP